MEALNKNPIKIRVALFALALGLAAPALVAADQTAACLLIAQVVPSFAVMDMAKDVTPLSCSQDVADQYEFAKLSREYTALFFPGNTKVVIRPFRVGSHTIEVKGSLKEFDVIKAVLGDRLPQGLEEKALKCTSAECVLIKGFNGDKISALRATLIAGKYGFAPAMDQSANYDDKGNALGTERIWTRQDLEKIDEAFQNLPKIFNYRGSSHLLYVPIEKISVEARDYLQKQDKKNSDVSFEGQATIQHALSDPKDLFSGSHLYFLDEDDVTKLRKRKYPNRNYLSKRSSDIVHELGHYVEYTSPKIFQDYRDQFCEKVERIEKDENGEDIKVVVFLPKKEFGSVTEYAKRDCGEDFAESISHFATLPDSLRVASTLKYEFVKQRIFDDRDVPFYGKRNWDQLDQAIKAEGGCNAIATSCMQNLKIVITKDGKFAADGEYSDKLIENLRQLPQCFLPGAQHLAETLKLSHESYCLNGGVRGIAEQLAITCKSDVELSVKTYQNSVIQGDHSNPVRTGIFAKIEPIEVLSTCLMNIDRVFVEGDTVYYGSNARGRPNPNPLDDLSCRDALKDLIAKTQANPSQESMESILKFAFKEPLFNSLITSFSEMVVKPWAQISRSCGQDSKCLETGTNNLLSTWENRYHFAKDNPVFKKFVSTRLLDWLGQTAENRLLASDEKAADAVQAGKIFWNCLEGVTGVLHRDAQNKVTEFYCDENGKCNSALWALDSCRTRATVAFSEASGQKVPAEALLPIFVKQKQNLLSVSFVNEVVKPWNDQVGPTCGLSDPNCDRELAEKFMKAWAATHQDVLGMVEVPQTILSNAAKIIEFRKTN